MRRRRGNAKKPPPDPPAFGNQPFRALEKEQRKRRSVRNSPERQAVPPPPAAPEVEGEALFQRAMHGVRPLPMAERAVHPAPRRPPEASARRDETAEALAELSDLVSGEAPFDISHSSDFVEGCAGGLDPRLLRRLRRGEFAYQSHLDLHGMSSDQARAAVDSFLGRAVRVGHRCVLIVHGRGLNSKDQIPVLKGRLTTWLGRGSWSRMVLAFCTARQCDGGLGALYVLLRRRRHDRKDIRVTEGARW